MTAVRVGMRVLVATKPVDFRRGADSLVAQVASSFGTIRSPDARRAVGDRIVARPTTRSPAACRRRLKRFLDLLAAVIIIVVLSPIWLLVGTVAPLDVGSPIFFWQQRLGQGGRPFLLQKIRTLKPPFDWKRLRARIK